MRRLFLFWLVISLIACKSKTGEQKFDNNRPVFERVNSNYSGLNFENRIQENVETNENLLDFDYFYNGAGVGIADINNDGLQDIFFCANQGFNKLYLNKGDLKFEDISDQAGINKNKNWSNGVTFADVNGDGWMDIYVSQGGPFTADKRKNLLFINQKDLTFKEEAETNGLADSGISTQSVFLDYDRDGDLDCMVMNENPLFGIDPVEFYKIIGTRPALFWASCSHLYQNNGGLFTDITQAAGLLQPSFGLGLVASDLNEDGWVDLYVANDYYLPDALYINQKDGTFSDEIKSRTKQISFYGMGADIADINNDGLQDIFVLDMASQDHYRSKTLMASMSVENFDLLVKRFKFPYQYMFNSLQMNLGIDKFANAAQMAGIAKTDWSWAGLMVDWDNDGLKEIFVSNGYRKYALDNDFKNEVNKMKDLYDGAIPISVKRNLYEMMPTEKLPNILYKNDGNFAFKDISDKWGLGAPSYSNGAAYADLDNDGDLELVVNNMDEVAFLYKNLATEQKRGNYLRVQAESDRSETFAKVYLKYDGKIQMMETKRVKGYLSSTENIAHFGLGKHKIIDTVQVVWENGTVTEKYKVAANQLIQLSENTLASKNPAPEAPYKTFQQVSIGQLKLLFRHKENNYDDFSREILLPYKQSTLGPAICKGDVNGDGKEDLFVGGAAGQSGRLFVQQNGQFRSLENPAFTADAAAEDMEAVFFDLDLDGDQDLYVSSGGNAFSKNAANYIDRLYINNGDGVFEKSTSQSLSNYAISGKSVTALDMDMDGDMDLIVGNRIIPQSYPKAAPSVIYKNENGQLVDVTREVAPDFENFGIVNEVISTDFDNNGWMDFIAVGEWGPIGLFKNTGGKFENVSSDSQLSEEKGWWFSIGETDINQDGLKDYLVGNIGLNSKFKASKESPFRIYGNDFDANGTFDVVLSSKYKDKYVPVRGRECSSQQMPFIAKKFKTYDAFAKASLEDIYGDKLNSSVQAEASQFKTVLLLNKGNGQFDLQPLPLAAQSFPVLSSVFIDLNNDGYEDAIIAGNIYDMEVETPRMDSGSGLVLFSNKKDGYTVSTARESGLFIDGDVKQLQLINIDNTPYLLAARNNELLSVFAINSQPELN